MKRKNKATPTRSIDESSALRSHQVFDELFTDFPLKALSASLGLHENTLGTWRKPSNHTAGQLRYNPLDRIVQLCTTTRDLRLLEWLCVQFDAYLVTNPANQNMQQSLHQASAHVTQRFAGMIECIAVAVSDETVSDEESVAIRAQWERLKSVVEAFVNGCERRDFAAVGVAMTNFTQQSQARPVARKR